MHIKKIISFVIALMIAASVMSLSSCTTKQEDTSTEKQFTFTVVDDKGEETVFELTTTKKYLRGALEDEKLISGDESPLGLMITHVNGLRAVYELDCAYWSLYIGDEYAMTGVDKIVVTDGGNYRFVYTKA